jgi:hypothetical protein
MNDDEKELLKVGAETAMKPFADLINKLFGGPVEQIGGMWTDGLVARRQIRQLKLIQKVKEAVDKAGFDPSMVRDKVGVNLLQAALLEDDETMQDAWANMLANESDPRKQNPVEPIFPAVLKDLSPREVRFLNRLHDVALADVIATQDGETMLSDLELTDAFVKAGLTRWSTIGPLNLGEVEKGGEALQQDLKDFALSVSILIRAGLLRTEIEAEHLDVSSITRGSNNAPRRLDLPISTRYIFTQLAYRFVAACKRPRGTCRLCLKEKDLRESHYMPAALYPKNAKELVFTTQEAAHTDRFEVKQYLLCFDCEQRFSNDGESEVLRLVAAKLVPKKPHEFPLMELLTSKTPFHDADGLRAYSAEDVDIDAEKFTYFALSLAWRASITSWELPGNLKTTIIDLGAHQEALRTFLLGETAFPNDVAVIMTVCTDEETRRNWIIPTRSPEAGCETIVFSSCGFLLRVWFGPGIPERFKRSCLRTSAHQPIFLTDCEVATKTVMTNLRGTPPPS